MRTFNQNIDVNYLLYVNLWQKQLKVIFETYLCVMVNNTCTRARFFQKIWMSYFDRTIDVTFYEKFSR